MGHVLLYKQACMKQEGEITGTKQEIAKLAVMEASRCNVEKANEKMAHCSSNKKFTSINACLATD